MRSGIYTLVDGAVVVAEGVVTFPQYLNSRMSFEKARLLMKDGAELVRASHRQHGNSEFAYTSRDNRYVGLPQFSEYWYNVEDGYSARKLSKEDMTADDWVIIVPPLSITFAHHGNDNYVKWRPLPESLQWTIESLPDDELVPF